MLLTPLLPPPQLFIREGTDSFFFQYQGAFVSLIFVYLIVSMKYLIYIFLFSLSGCSEPIDKTSHLKEKYSDETINYFYEVAFHAEAESNKTHPVRKWNKDIQLFIEGDTLPGDVAKINKTISQLNDLHLPIKIYTTNNKRTANMLVCFGTRESLHMAEFVGGEGIIESEKWIERAEVHIQTEPSKSVNDRWRENVITEEITQCLGITGDSYFYPLSVFYERPNTVTQLANIDKQVLQLLYDPAMPVGYSCEQFEKDFSEQLHHVNSEEKLLQYLQEQAVSKQTLECIIQDGLITGDEFDQARIVKFNQPIAVTVQGDTTAVYVSLLRQTIQQLNQTSSQLQLYLAEDSLPYDGGLHYHFIKKEMLSNPANSIETKVVTNSTQQLLFHRRFSTDVYISYKDVTSLSEKMPLAIANALYQTICLLHQPAPLFFTYLPAR